MTSEGEPGLPFGGCWGRRRRTLSRDGRTVAVRWWFDGTGQDGEIALPMQPVPPASDSAVNGTDDHTPTLLKTELNGQQDETVDHDNWRERVWIQR